MCTAIAALIFTSDGRTNLAEGGQSAAITRCAYAHSLWRKACHNAQPHSHPQVHNDERMNCTYRVVELASLKLLRADAANTRQRTHSAWMVFGCNGEEGRGPSVAHVAQEDAMGGGKT